MGWSSVVGKERIGDDDGIQCRRFYSGNAVWKTAIRVSLSFFIVSSDLRKLLCFPLFDSFWIYLTHHTANGRQMCGYTLWSHTWWFPILSFSSAFFHSFMSLQWHTGPFKRRRTAVREEAFFPDWMIKRDRLGISICILLLRYSVLLWAWGQRQE